MVSSLPKPTSANHSAGRLLKIMECMADTPEPMRLLDIANELDMNTSTLSRFMTTLVECGYAKQDPETLKYSLTYKICVLGNKVKSNFDLPNVARPYLKELVHAFPEMVSLGIEQNNKVVYIETIQGKSRSLQVLHRIGSIAPMHCTGIGKLLLLNYSEPQIDKLIAECGLERFTDHTLTTKEALMAELQAIRQTGYAFDKEECEIGVSCIAYPVYNESGKIIAAVSVSGPTTRQNVCFSDPVNIKKGLDIVARLSKEMGYTKGRQA